METIRAKSRNGDPETSDAAALAVERSGRAGSQRRNCLKAVRAVPGMTAAEIAEACALERHVPSRRLPELRRAGLVSNGPARICRVTRTSSMTWDPVAGLEISATGGSAEPAAQLDLFGDAALTRRLGGL